MRQSMITKSDLLLLLIALLPLIYMMITGEFPGQTIFYGLAEDHEIVDLLLTLRGIK